MASFDYIRETNDVLLAQQRKAQAKLKAIRLGDDSRTKYDEFVREHSLTTVILLSEVRKKHYGI